MLEEGGVLGLATEILKPEGESMATSNPYLWRVCAEDEDAQGVPMANMFGGLLKS